MSRLPSVDDEAAAAPLAKVFATSDLEEARCHMSDYFSPHTASGKPSLRTISFQHRFATLSAICVDMVDYGCNDNDVVIRTPQLEGYDVFIIPIDGVACMSAGGPIWEVGNGTVVYLRNGEPFFQKPGTGYRCLSVKVPSELSQDYGFSRLPMEYCATALFGTVGQLAQVDTRCVQHLIQSALCLSDTGQADRQSLTALKATLETSILHALLDLYHLPAKQLQQGTANTPYFVRQAVDFIEANHKAAIFVQDISTAACVSVRTLQLGFSKHVGLSPMQYLRQARLDASRHALLYNRGVSVTQAAMTHGFDHLGRFSATYCDRFGELPSDTLNKW